MDIKIRNATPFDIHSLCDFARSVGRFLGEDEIRTWMQVDPESFFVAETCPEGKLIGSCCGTQLTPELGFMGFYVVLEEYRGKGIGMKLWKAAKEHLGDRNIGVRAVPSKFKKFTEKDGFTHVEDYIILYYDFCGDFQATNINFVTDIEVATYFEGCLIGVSKTLCNDACSVNMLKTGNGSSQIESSETSFEERMTAVNATSFEKSPLLEEQYKMDNSSNVEHYVSLPISATLSNATTYTENDEVSNVDYQLKSNIGIRKDFHGLEDIPFHSMTLITKDNLKSEDILSKVFDFDKSLHKRDRSLLVRQTFSWSSCRSKVAILCGQVVGYACLRHVVTEHWIISPFYANTKDIAETLLFELLKGFDFSQAPKGIQIRFPDKNINCKRLVEKLGFKETSTLILTGFTKQCIGVDTSKVYSFHSAVFCSE